MVMLQLPRFIATAVGNRVGKLDQMILPLRSTREVWAFDWFDLDVPIQFGSMFILPTCLYLVHRHTGMLLGHEFVRELDQRRVELFLHRAFQEKGAPDELLVPDVDEWDESVWRSFSKEYQCRINLVDAESSELDPSEEDALESQLSNLIAGPAENLLATHGATFVAQGLVKAVKQTRSRDKQRALLAKALDLSENLPDALLELADLDFQEGNLDEAAEGFAKAAEVAGPSHVQGEPGCYLRAQHGRLIVAWQKGDLNDAISIGEELLFTDPTDHSGVRFLVPLLQLSLGQFEASNEYFAWYRQSYPGDLEDPGLMFGWGLTLFEFDEEVNAVERYKRGMLQNFYLAPMLLDLPEPSPELWQHHQRGDYGYAIEFVDSFGVIWERDAGATRFLRELYVSLLPQLDVLIDVRRQMAEVQDNRYEPNHRKIWDELVAEERHQIARWGLGEK
jgi:tetratricopeptide (TPR) repeat protein